MAKFTRKPNRLPNKEIYKSNNSFFVTICVQDRVCCLSQIQDGKVNLSPNTGEIVEGVWLNLPEIFTNIVLDEYVIMPNHFHGIITFLDIPTRKSNGKSIDLSEIIRTLKAKSKRLIDQKIEERFIVQKETGFISQKETGFIVQKETGFISQKETGFIVQKETGFIVQKETGFIVQDQYGSINASPTNASPTNLLNFQWQKSFYDHVIRNEKDMKRIQEYIYNNPFKWELDLLNPSNNDKFQEWLVKNP